MSVVAALDFIQHREKHSVPSFCVVAGEDAFLRRETLNSLKTTVLGEGDAEFSLSRFDGATASFNDVLSETSTVALFGSGKKLVFVEQAEPFLSQNKELLEDYLDAPCSFGILVLILNSFPSNLRLYKKTNEKGVIFDCKPLASKLIPSWLVDWSKNRCGATFSRESAELLVELSGDDLGALEQEARRLALLTPDGVVTSELVRSQVGSNRQRKVWDLVDVALAGGTSEALRQLDMLIASGEAPIAILAQMAASFRKLAAATQLFSDVDSSDPPLTVSSALEKVGVRSFVASKSADQLKKLGSRRARKLVQNLLQADLDMKGGSRCEPQIILERFIVAISNPQMRSFDSLR